jgi:hypothetical protein
MNISLGTCDPDLDADALQAYLANLREITGEASGRLIGDKGPVSFEPLAGSTTFSVAALQQALIEAGMLPGGKADGICGYRTRAGIRLFQEYLRSVEEIPCLPDGIAGPKTMGQLRRWVDQGLRADWEPRLQQWMSGTLAGETCEYNDWLTRLRKVQSDCAAHPHAMQQLVEAFSSSTDTHPVAEWRYTSEDIHLLGIRRNAQARTHKFDDVFVLLIAGLVFKFQGSTDPGSTSNPLGAPFLVNGQHDYQFGLHQGKYHALRPLHHNAHGVLVVRTRGDFSLTSADLSNGVQTNGTINIHWGGKGVGRAVNRWSEGCQVINGSSYQNHNARIVSCTDYVAINNTEVKERSKNKTRGAYNVLSDLIVAFSSRQSEPGLVKYSLLDEDQLSRQIAVETLALTKRFMQASA